MLAPPITKHTFDDVWCPQLCVRHVIWYTRSIENTHLILNTVRRVASGKDKISVTSSFDQIWLSNISITAASTKKKQVIRQIKTSVHEAGKGVSCCTRHILKVRINIQIHLSCGLAVLFIAFISPNNTFPSSKLASVKIFRKPRWAARSSVWHLRTSVRYSRMVH